MKANLINNTDEDKVMMLTQRWSNIGLAVAFFFTASFIFFFLNTKLLKWWEGLSDSIFVTVFCNILLFIPTLFLLLICLAAHEYFNSVPIRIFNLICFSFLFSVLLVFFLCVGSEFSKLASTYSIGIFLFYTLIVMFALATVDVFFLPLIDISDSPFIQPIIKTIESLPLTYLIWSASDVGWVWLIPLQVFVFYFFYFLRTSFSWSKISESYLQKFSYKGPVLKKSLLPVEIDMFAYDYYKIIGLYLTLYNVLPNVLNVMNDTVNMFDDVGEIVDEEQKKKGENFLKVLYPYILENESHKDIAASIPFSYLHKSNVPSALSNPKFILMSFVFGVLFYISVCYMLTFVGNLFEPI